MKPTQHVIISALTLVTLLVLALPSSQAQAVSIADPNIEQAIRDDIGKASGDLTLKDLEKVTFLDLSAKGMTQINMPEGLINLETLDLSDNALTGTLFSPVKFPDDMLSLTDLDLSRNQLGSIAFLSKFPNLRFLNLSRNGFESLKFPEGHVNLEELNLSSNGLATLTIPTGMTALQRLDLSRNNLVGSVFAPISLPNDMSSLTFLDMSFNELGGFKLPSGMVNLTQLILFNNKLTSLELPEDIGALIKLDVYGNSLKNLTLPLGARSLEVLDLGNNPDLKTVTVPEGVSDDIKAIILRWENIELIEFKPPLPAVYDAKRLDNGDFEGTFDGSNRYVLYRSEDLETWAEVKTIVSEGTTTFNDAGARKLEAAFYRLGYAEPLPEEE